MEQTIPLLSEPVKPFPNAVETEIISVFIADHPVVRYGVSATIGGETDIKVIGESSDGWQAIS